MRSTSNPKNIPPPGPVRSTTELAQQLGLSRWTVSRVINGHDGVHPETVERVRAAMRESGFSPNPLAQGLRRGRTNIIGVCVPDLEDFYLGPKLEALRRTVAAEGFHVMVGMTDGDTATEVETLDHFRLLRAAGVVTLASQLSPKSEAVHRLKETRIPLLLVDPVVAPTPGGLGINRASGMREATRHLLDLGHRRIATLGIDSESFYTHSRFEAIREVLQPRGLEAKRIPLPARASCYEAACNGAEVLFPGGRRSAESPTAILAVNDRVAMGLIEGLRVLGLRVPEDVSIIGYDNMEAAAFIAPKLTTIDPCPDELIKRTATRLLQLIRDYDTPPERTVRTPTRLIIRESTCKNLDGI